MNLLADLLHGDSVPDLTRSPGDHKLSVGNKTFPERRWREAIQCHLFDFWSGKNQGKEWTSIFFGSDGLFLELRVGKSDTYYIAQGRHHPYSPDLRTDDARGEALYVGSDGPEVRDALMRFVKDSSVGYLVIYFSTAPFYGELTLFKKERRGEYGCSYKRTTWAPPLPYCRD